MRGTFALMLAAVGSLCLAPHLHGQAHFVEAWVKTYDGPFDGPTDKDEATAIAVDDGGNVYVTGTSLGLSSNFDYLTIMYDSHGDVVWESRYEGDGSDLEDYARALAVDASGNVYVTGMSARDGSGFDIATVKYGPDGRQLWATPYIGLGSKADEGKAIAVDDVGNVYVAGYCEALKGTRSTRHYVTIKYDSTGVEQWTKTYCNNTNYPDQAVALALDPDGNVYVTGQSCDAAGIPYVLDYATIKYAPDGSRSWVARYNYVNGFIEGHDTPSDLALLVLHQGTPDQKTYVYVTGGSYRGRGSQQETDYATLRYRGTNGERIGQPWVYKGRDYIDRAVALTIDGSFVYVTGRSAWLGHRRQIATIKYDIYGNRIWFRHFKGSGYGDNAPCAIVTDASGHVHVTGTGKEQSTANDIVTITYDGAGNRLAVMRYDGGRNKDDVASDMAIDGHGNLYVTGKSIGATGRGDYVTIKYEPARYQPNTRVRIAGAPLFRNDTESQEVKPGEVAVYDLRIQNDGNVVGALAVEGEAGSGAWTVGYYDEPTGGDDITSSVNGPDGWLTDDLAAGEYKDIRLEVSPGWAAPGGSVFPISVTSTSWTEEDTVTTYTTVNEAYGPVNLIGNDSQSVDPDQTAIYHVTVRNDGNTPDGIRVTGTGDAPGWGVKYYFEGSSGTDDITDDVTAVAGYPLPTLEREQEAVIRVEVTPGRFPPTGGTSYPVTVTSTSGSDPDAVDTVIATTTVNKDYRTVNEVGNDSQSVDPDQTAIYHVTVRNDGNTADSIRVNGTGDDMGWVVRYFEGLSGSTDITDHVTVAVGYPLAPLDPGQEAVIRVEVTPGRFPPTGGSSYPVTVTSTSGSDPDAVDAVIASTTVNEVYRPVNLIVNDAQSVDPDQTAIYDVTVRNGANTADGIRVNGTGDAPGWAVKYYFGPDDITDDVIVLGKLFPTLEPGQDVAIRVEVTPGWMKAPDEPLLAGSSYPVTVTSTSGSDPDAIDTVIASTTVNGVYRPVNLIVNDAQSVDPDQTAIYDVTVRNDGNTADGIRVNGTGGAPGWAVKYYFGPDDITDDVIVLGKLFPTLEPGQDVAIRVEVTPGSFPPTGGSSYPVTVTSTSGSDPDAIDTVIASTTVNEVYRPVNLIVNDAQSVDPDQTAIYDVTVRNGANTADGIRVNGTGDAPGWAVKYYFGPDDITDDVIVLGKLFPTLEPGQDVAIRVEVTPGWMKAPDEPLLAGSSYPVTVTSTSGSDPDAIDTVIASTTVNKAYRPDNLLRLVSRGTETSLSKILRGSSASFVGAGVFSTDPDLQVYRHFFLAPEEAIYHVRIENDGNATDSIRVNDITARSAWKNEKLLLGAASNEAYNPRGKFEPAPSNAHWTVRYFAVGKHRVMDITDKVKGAGWLTKVGVGQHRDVAVLVRAHGEVRNTSKVVVQSRSNKGYGDKDVVKAVTTDVGVFLARPVTPVQ